MSRMLRALASSFVALLTLWPTAASAASPTPSPSIEQLLASPPTGFSEVTSAAIHGHFTAHQYASNADVSKQTNIENTLTHDGFIDGFGNTWVHNVAKHVLVEEVFAFTGGRGALDWLNAAEVGDKGNTTFQHADSITGIDKYYGEHIFDSASNPNLYGDAFAFAKGNDVFVVGVVSIKDDALDEATSQTHTQYSVAPDQTIPSSQWPENQIANNVAFKVGGTVGGLLIFGLVLAAVALVTILVVARRRSVPAVQAAYAGVPSAPIPPQELQMSPDGNFWWDGQTWRDAAHGVPPAAQRSPDGGFWWDGRAWRPVPQAPPPG
jgi:hypothetical protein